MKQTSDRRANTVEVHSDEVLRYSDPQTQSAGGGHQGPGEGRGREVVFNGGRASVWEGGKVLETEGGDPQQCGCV